MIAVLLHMKPELSDNPIWITSTSEILALDGKVARIIDKDGRTRVNLRVTNADPRGPDAGKCSVAVWQSIMTGEPQWSNTGGTPPTQTSHGWRGFLNEAAVDSLVANAEEPESKDLQIDLT